MWEIHVYDEDGDLHAIVPDIPTLFRAAREVENLWDNLDIGFVRFDIRQSEFYAKRES